METICPLGWLAAWNERFFVVGVIADGKEIYRSPLSEADRLYRVNLNVIGVKQIELIVQDGGNGADSDWAIWFDPRVVR